MSLDKKKPGQRPGFLDEPVKGHQEGLATLDSFFLLFGFNLAVFYHDLVANLG